MSSATPSLVLVLGLSVSTRLWKSASERVPLGSIAGVLDGPTMRPFQITLNLDQPCRFGQKITFIPRYRLVWNGLHPLVDELRSRVEAGRGNRPGMNSKKAEPNAAADGGGG
jgi:hypothetical protein